MPRVRAPEFPGNYPWLNTDKGLSIGSLKGRVVLLDFWTYCCINCLHVLPDLKYLEQKYKDSLTVIGVHSAKFDNEKEVENIRQAILRYDIEHPVIVDSEMQVWQSYAVRAWPTLMVIDPEGYVIGYVSGEGNREPLDELIGKLIAEYKDRGAVNFSEQSFSLEKQRKPLVMPLAFPGKVLAFAITATEAKKLHQHEALLEEITENSGSVDESVVPGPVNSVQQSLVGSCLFIADSGHNRIVVSTTEGEVLHVIGTGKAGLTDGNFAEAEFLAPQGMAFDADGQILYVADTENHAIRKVDFTTQRVETIAGTGEQSHEISVQAGKALETKLNSPWDLEKVGNRLFVAMAGSHQIWEMQLDAGTIAVYAGNGRESCVDGNLGESAFSQPSGLSTDRSELFVADSEISSIRAIGIDENPKVRTVCGSGDLFGFGDKDGRGDEVRLQHCLGVEYAQNYLWVADTYNHKIKRIDHRSGNCIAMVGDGKAGYLDGKGIHAQFFEPSGVSAIGPHLFVADTNNHVIRQVELNTLEVTTLHLSGLCAPDVCLPE
ncbi:MAG: redoxin domain-containing protein [Oscillatoriaceae cyanobacterium Prado104]|jgi:DNA-binding beta-propeller fold protein YncE|nr:redoxin domain-containing protein [Oscillatoriaceae cyanobacterium Prado104]